MNKTFAQAAKDYKRSISNQFMLVDGNKIKEKLSGEDFFVTRKTDGILQVIFVRDGKLEAYNTGGKQTPELPCLQEFAELCKKAGVINGTFASELYACLSGKGRERVGDTISALAKAELHSHLRLTPFNIIDINGQSFEGVSYNEIHARLKQIFSGGKLVKTVPGKEVHSTEEVAETFASWVTGKGSEGLVVHGDSTMVWKIKPRHSIDAAVIGYTTEEDDENMVREMLLAVATPEGLFQQMVTVGTGLTEEDRRLLAGQLSRIRVKSEYIETDSRNIAFQMVAPELVVEIFCIDVVSENNKNEPKLNRLLSYDNATGYILESIVAGAALHSPVFVRVRDDKTPSPTDIRIKQITDLCAFSDQQPVSLKNLPKSQVLMRRVFIKGEGEKLMVQKYLIWKTNKEQTGVFPAYVMHYTDFSCSRKEPLKHDIRVSSSERQIYELCENMIESNIKKDWQEIC